MDKQITTYLIEERKVTSTERIKRLEKKICKYDDIKNEFLKWLEVRNYDYPNPLIISGYSAKDIYQMAPNLDGIGVYNFMITLREKPETALEIIDQGFPIL